jgi:hypothetical protein
MFSSLLGYNKQQPTFIQRMIKILKMPPIGGSNDNCKAMMICMEKYDVLNKYIPQDSIIKLVDMAILCILTEFIKTTNNTIKKNYILD